MNRRDVLLRRIRALTLFFIIALVLSGATAIPLRTELNWLAGSQTAIIADSNDSLSLWLVRVRDALNETGERHPFLFYGTDWLAFAHFVIAIAFVGAWRHPVRNAWLYRFGMIACALIIPFACAFGNLRGIPWGWRLIDCSFGIFGSIPMFLCVRWVAELEVGGGDFSNRMLPGR